tara:strand:- start:474 stop:899 length:426 start_codon:yes stop_codon:yes gene_type:complete
MTNLKLTTDFNDFTNHELEVALSSIKQQKDDRDALFMKQFTEGVPLAITTNLIDEDRNYKVFPAYITKVNKKSIEVGFTTFNDYTPRNSFLNDPKKYTIKQLKTNVHYGWMRRAFPSTFMGRDGLYENYPKIMTEDSYAKI